MNFESQICTTKEQSERLLALGLKKETADCFLEYVGIDNYGNKVWHPSIIVNNYKPSTKIIPTCALIYCRPLRLGTSIFYACKGSAIKERMVTDASYIIT